MSERPCLGSDPGHVEKGLISEIDLAHALSLQKHHGGRIGEILVGEGLLTLAQLTAAVSEQCGIGREEVADSLRARLSGRRPSGV